jgi:hypothetical protein
MDTSEQATLETSSHTKMRRRTVEEKRRIVEETLVASRQILTASPDSFHAFGWQGIATAQPFFFPHVSVKQEG